MLLVAGLLVMDPGSNASIRVKVVNAVGHRIERVYASPSDAPTWGEELLKGHLIKTGDTTIIHLKDGCGTYDLRFVASEGVEYMDEDVRFCEDDDVVTLHKGAVKKSKVQPTQ